MHLDNILRAQGKLYVLEKPVSRPESNSPERDFTQYFKYLEDESDVMSILIFSTSPEFTGDLRVKSCYQVVKDIENQLGLYKHTGKLLIMQEIFSLKLKSGQSVKDHLIEMRRLFKCLSRLGYKMTQEELVYLMWFSLTKEIQDTASAYMKEPKKDVDKVHEDILASLEPIPEPADLMDTDVIDELGDLSCPECGSEDICEHSMNIDQIEIDLPDAPGIFMIDCLITSYESWVIDTGSGNHICNHLQGFTRRKTLRKDRSNLRVGEGTPLIAEAVGSYSLSLPSGLVLELDNYVCGPFSHVAKGGYRYFITFTDDFSRYGYVYLMRHKSESFERFKEFQNEVQNQLDRKIKFLRSDRGGVYLSDEFDNHLMECGIVSQLTPPYTPQMNGVSERRNRTLLDMIYHGRFFTKKPGREYVQGRMNYVDLVDTDEFSVHELEAMVETLGYQTCIPTFYHFNVPGLSLDCGLQALGNDDDVRSFLKHVGSSKVFSIYVEHRKPTVDTYLRSPRAVGSSNNDN
ncbi:hypothetical protein OSB04_016542 [Centaurea solstitialis]|uniref:Integrase catalytic domain-containing protein n=1 Tax=Centaurea solstitialis TaxID=347529 RepID=A0AA38W9W7_9ASTR|nr:hypothetical protein OSB04_016542 [Centaurea solstitialis]